MLNFRTPRFAAPLVVGGLTAALSAGVAFGWGEPPEDCVIEIVTFEKHSNGENVHITCTESEIGPICVEGSRPYYWGDNFATIFDSSNPSPADLDLGTTSQGNILIVGDVNSPILSDVEDVPDTKLDVYFSSLPAPYNGSVRLLSFRAIDFDAADPGARVTLFDAGGNVLFQGSVPSTPDNGVAVYRFGDTGIPKVAHMKITFLGDGAGGAIDDIRFTCNETPPEEPPEPPEPPEEFVCDGGIKCIGLQYQGTVSDATVTISSKKGDEVFGVFPNLQPGDVITSESPDEKFPSEIVVTTEDSAGNFVSEVRIHVSCSQPIGLGFLFGDFEITKLVNRVKGDKPKKDKKKKDKKDKDKKDKDDDDPNAGLEEFDCKGGLSAISLIYLGDEDDVTIEVTEKKGKDLFGSASGLNSGDVISATADGDKFPSEIVVVVFDASGDEISSTPIHVSCSKPIGFGFRFGDFEVSDLTEKLAKEKKDKKDKDDKKKSKKKKKKRKNKKKRR